MSGPFDTATIAPPLIVEMRDLIADYCGVFYDDARSSMVETALQQRAKALGIAAETYAELVRADTAELQRLAELVLNHETQFYRNRAQMATLERVILPELHRRLPAQAPLRLWSAGCATGEEAYSLAIAVYEALGDPLPRPVEVWATDLSSTALERARLGVYKARSCAHLSSAQRGRYFEAVGDALTPTAKLRQLVQFQQFNLLAPFPPQAAGVHLVSCQNVTIYFRLATCRALMERYYEVLADGGYLLLGFSETLWTIFERFRWREESGVYVYYKESQSTGQSEAPLSQTPPTAHKEAEKRAAARPAAHKKSLTTSASTQAEIVERGRALLEAGRAEAALELVARAPLVGSDAPRLLALAARAHADRGELDLAAAEARRVLELNPLATEAHLLIGIIQVRQGRPEVAVHSLERARCLDGASPVIAFHLAECYRYLGRTASALREYRNARIYLATHPPDQPIEGVAPGWLSETCRHYETMLEHSKGEGG